MVVLVSDVFYWFAPHASSCGIHDVFYVVWSIFFVQILAVDHASAEGAIVPTGSPRTKVIATCHFKHLSPTVFPNVDLVNFYCDKTDDSNSSIYHHDHHAYGQGDVTRTSASSSSSSASSSLSSHSAVGHDNLYASSSSASSSSSIHNAVVSERVAHWANIFYSNADDCVIFKIEEETPESPQMIDSPAVQIGQPAASDERSVHESETERDMLNVQHSDGRVEETSNDDERQVQEAEPAMLNVHSHGTREEEALHGDFSTGIEAVPAGDTLSVRSHEMREETSNYNTNSVAPESGRSVGTSKDDSVTSESGCSVRMSTSTSDEHKAAATSQRRKARFQEPGSVPPARKTNARRTRTEQLSPRKEHPYVKKEAKDLYMEHVKKANPSNSIKLTLGRYSVTELQFVTALSEGKICKEFMDLFVEAMMIQWGKLTKFIMTQEIVEQLRTTDCDLRTVANSFPEHVGKLNTIHVPLHEEDRWILVAHNLVNWQAEIYDPVCKSEDKKLEAVVETVARNLCGALQLREVENSKEFSVEYPPHIFKSEKIKVMEVASGFYVLKMLGSYDGKDMNTLKDFDMESYWKKLTCILHDHGNVIWHDCST